LDKLLKKLTNFLVSCPSLNISSVAAAAAGAAAAAAA